MPAHKMSDHALFLITYTDDGESDIPTYMNGFMAEKLLNGFNVNYEVKTYYSYTYITFEIKLDHNYDSRFSQELREAISNDSREASLLLNRRSERG